MCLTIRVHLILSSILFYLILLCVSIVTQFVMPAPERCYLNKHIITLYGAPFCFPSQNPLAVHLVLLVTAHNSKRNHLLLSAHMQTHTHESLKCYP